jgi:glycosyltransferase involved in cell wall biosynthesis
MKILLVSYYGWRYGGGETYLYAIRDELRARGHDVRIFASDNGQASHQLDADYTFKTARTKVGWALASLWNPRSYRALRRARQDFQPDLVLINSTSNETSPSVTSALRGVPTMMWVMSRYVFTPDASLPLWYKPYAFVNTLARTLCLRNVDRYLTTSKAMFAYIPKNKQPLTVLPICVKALPYSPIANYDTVFFAGRIVREKGVDVLIRAFNIVHRQLPGAKLRIAGDGPELATCQQLTASLGLQDTITFLGYLDADGVQQHMRASTIVTMPSVYEEPFGLSGIEAMFIGRPVIGSRIGGIPDWLDEARVGKLVEAGNAEALAQAIISLLSDQTKLDALSVSASKEAQQYSVQNHTTQLEAIAREIIGA